MSAEADIRTALAAHAPLTALVSTRIALDAVPQGSAYPLVVYAVQHSPDISLSGEVLADACTVSLQCWAADTAAALQVAAAVRGALAAHALAQAALATITGEETAFDAELDLHAVQLTLEWWVLGS